MACGSKKDNNSKPMNTMGNTAANHANRGLLCGYGDWIYYNDYSKNGYLCRSLQDGTNKEVILEERCFNINIVSDSIYYQSEEIRTIKKCNMDGSNVLTLIEDPVADMIVTSDTIYFLTDSIEKVDLDGNNRTNIMPEGEYYYLDYQDNSLFYTSLENGVDLYRINQDESKSYILLEEAKGSVVIDNNVYYTGVEDNMLYCYGLVEKTSKQIDKGYNVNVRDDNIYYIKENQIYCFTENKQCEYYSTEYFSGFQEDCEIEFYYIVNDYMYLIYHSHEEEISKFIWINLETLETGDL